MSLRVVIAEDEAIIRMDLRETLEEEGYDVVGETGRGDEAVRLVRDLLPDLAVLDVKMPGMNGVESFLEIKKIKPDVKVFMMTGYSVEQLLEEALDNGALGVMRKPFDVEELIAKLNGIKEGLVVVADADATFTSQIVPILKSQGYDVLVARSADTR